MGWTRNSGRVARDRRRPCLELLETRQLLSTAKAHPAAGSNLNSDGSTNFDQIIQASTGRTTYGVDGTGETVAVIDTGADYKNPALGGAIGPGDKVVTGVDFTNSPNGVLPSWQHGTGVAGLVAGTSGVAPGSDIVPLRVFGDNNQGSFTQIAQALDWVIQNHALYNITAVNLSVSDGNNYTSNQFASDGSVGQQITQDVNALDALNIPVVVAAGNSFDGKTQGMGFPAIIPGTISVTATDANDVLASDAQRLGTGVGAASATTIAAPGVGITAPSGDSGTTTEDGTSFATPQVTGAVLLLQQMYQKAYHTLPTISELDQLLQEGAVTVHDSVTGINVGRLDVLNSLQILNTQIAASQSGSSNGGSTPGSTSGGTTTTGSTTTGTTTTGSGGSVTSTPTTPLTQVFVNGVSIGNYSTAQLAARYPSLFAFLKGPVPTLKIWAPAGTTVNLGNSTPSSASKITPTPSVKVAKAEVKAESTKAKTTPVKKVTPVVRHAVAKPKKATSTANTILSYLFPFKL